MAAENDGEDRDNGNDGNFGGGDFGHDSDNDRNDGGFGNDSSDGGNEGKAGEHMGDHDSEGGRAGDYGVVGDFVMDNLQKGADAIKDALSGEGGYSGEDNKYTASGLTVDEVFGSNKRQEYTSGVLDGSQGDYAASRNESSKVTGTTISDQSTVNQNAKMKSENVGLVENKNIDAVEGLVSKQKDKENENVLEARKRKDEAEAEDKSNKMTDFIKGNIEGAAKSISDALTKGEKGENFDFKVGDKSKEQKALDEANKNLKTSEASWNAFQKSVDNAFNKVDSAVTGVKDYGIPEEELTWNDVTFTNPVNGHTESFSIPEYTGDDSEAMRAIQKLSSAFTSYKAICNEAANAKSTYEKDKQAVADAEAALKASYETPATPAKPAPAETSKAVAETGTSDLEALKAAVATPEEAQIVDNLIASQNAIKEQTAKVANNLNDMSAAAEWVEANKTYLDNLKKTQDTFSNRTNFNKDYAKSIASATDFDVTTADGRKMSYSQVATDLVTKSPEIASEMYLKDAEKKTGIGKWLDERKADLVKSWAGSKITGVDNDIRNQFNQMADLNMRATYAAYNNVINDPNTTPELRAEAEGKIAQANALKSASAALNASTGFFDGAMSYNGKTLGTTDPEKLSGFQKATTAVKEFGQIALNLGVLPGANKAYQEIYYLNQGNEGLLSKVFGADLDKDGFAWTQEYGNNAAAQAVAAVGEMGIGLALASNPATAQYGITMLGTSFKNAANAVNGINTQTNDVIGLTEALIKYYEMGLQVEGIPEEAVFAMRDGVTQIENFKLKSDEVGQFDDWLEGSGNSTASNEKFNQALTFDEWMKLIESDETMREYAKKMVKNAQKDNADEGVNA